MPKENTHILFAANLIQHLDDPSLRALLASERDTFLLGAMIPDTLYYGDNRQVSDTLHGKTGNPTNTIILEMLDKGRDNRNFAFCCGYISHCALDIIFHPVVYYLSGNYYDPDPDKQEQAVYQHRHIETCLDAHIENEMRMHKLLSARLLEGLVYEKIIADTYQVDISQIRKTLRKQLWMNRFFNSARLYQIYAWLCDIGLFRDRKIEALFYANTRQDTCPDFSSIAYRDLLTGEELKTTLPELFNAARHKALFMITQAYAYIREEISLEELLPSIPGESLDTGILNAPVSDIKYTKNS